MQFAIRTIFRLKSLWPGLNTRYERIAQKWHASVSKLGYVQAYNDLINSAKSEFPTSRNNSSHRVLDAGCGSGAFSLSLCNNTTRPLSIDLLDTSKNMLTEAQYTTLASQPHPMHQICASIETVAAKDKLYDVILCAHVIDHLSDPVSALSQLREALAPEGIMLLVVSKPHWCTSLVQLKWHHHAYTPQKICKMLAEARFLSPTLFPFCDGPPKFTSHGYIVKSSKSKKESQC